MRDDAPLYIRGFQAKLDFVSQSCDEWKNHRT